jgi:hypothetical protein
LFEQDEGKRQEESFDNSGVTIRPAELASLLSRPTANRSIQWMKIITLVILVISCVVIGVQYSTILSFRSQMEQSFSEVKGLHELISEILYMKQYVLQSILYAPTDSDIDAFRN